MTDVEMSEHEQDAWRESEVKDDPDMQSEQECIMCCNSGIVLKMVFLGNSNNPMPVTHAELCECLAGEALGALIHEGMSDIEKGLARPWSEIKKELGIDAG